MLEALAEVGIDRSDHVPRRIDLDEVGRVDVVVSTSGEEACPVTPVGTRRVYWNLADPKGRTLDEVRKIRDDIHARVQQLLVEIDALRGGA